MASYEVAVWVVIFFMSVVLSGVAFVAGEQNRKREKHQTLKLWVEHKQTLCSIAMLKLEEYSEWCVEMRNNDPHLHFPLLLLQAQMPSNDARRIKEAELYREIAATYWDSVVDMYQQSLLDDSFFSSKILEKWQKYRNVVEAIDIANFYGRGFDRQHGEYYLEANRPGRYRLIEEIWLDKIHCDGGEKVGTTVWWKEWRKNVCEQVKGVRERLRSRPSEMHIEIGECSSSIHV
ncbi:hypothetical protein SUGI_0443670 [Cryptomeria japonica]|nr:hypothetical protein SUGI_0443670 [Cryptomeria japonica]